MGLFSIAQAGDPDALAALVRMHIPLVQALTRRFSYCEDAFQQGCIGLVTAIRKFREDWGLQFSTYAVPVILGEMRRAFSHTLGWRARATLRKAQAYRENKIRETGAEPSIGEIARYAHTTPEELALLLERNQPLAYDETGFLLSSLPDPSGDLWMIRFYIRDILSRMPPGEGWLIQQRFIRGRSQMELAQALHTTQSSISRREKLARLHFQMAWNE